MGLEQIFFLLFSLRASMQCHIHVPSPKSVHGVILTNIYILKCDFIFFYFSELKHKAHDLCIR